jgi:hypothetical protein
MMRGQTRRKPALTAGTSRESSTHTAAHHPSTRAAPNSNEGLGSADDVHLGAGQSPYDKVMISAGR